MGAGQRGRRGNRRRERTGMRREEVQGGRGRRSGRRRARDRDADGTGRWRVRDSWVADSKPHKELKSVFG